MTVCGLATVNLSSLTGWQQTILFIQMCLGSPVRSAHSSCPLMPNIAGMNRSRFRGSWYISGGAFLFDSIISLMSGTRLCHRYYFAKKFDHIIATEMASRAANKLATNGEAIVRPWPKRFRTLFRDRTALTTVIESTEEEKNGNKERRGGVLQKLRPDMIRRMDDAPKLVDPSGWISEGQSIPMTSIPTVQSSRQIAFADDKALSSSPPQLHRVLENNSAERSPDTSRPVHPSLT
jgi:hypothetical protein